MAVPPASLERHDPDRLMARARSWARLDPDPSTTLQLVTLIDAVERGDAPPDELAVLFDGRLQFGTAGIRGPLGPGPRRMNVLLAVQTAAGIARVLLDGADGAASPAQRGVIIGRDARHRSDAIAAAMAATFASHGIDVECFDGPVPTPLVATSVVRTGAASGVVVTASHNPGTDNGIKVYWSNGAQILTPIDRQISDAIDDVAAAMEAALAAGPIAGRSAAVRIAKPERGGAVRSQLGTATDGPTADDYISAALHGRPAVRATVPLALTSLHGVGAGLAERLLRTAGHDDLYVVADQRDPDPDFPTVRVPNPEEPGTLDRLIAVAAASGCVAGLANDPDADRLAVVVTDRSGTWRMLTGDEVGALLCSHLLDRHAAHDGGHPSGSASAAGHVPFEPLVSTTVVSGRLVQAIARSAGAHVVETLTGFKWLSRPAQQHPEWHQVLAYEEALGYAVGPDARDKDGITAALAVADLLSTLREAGRDVFDMLDVLAIRHGAHVTRNGWATITDDDATAAHHDLITRLSTAPPTSLGGMAIIRSDRPAPDVFRFWTEDDTRVALRPSGTEPKVKYYCEAIVAVTPPDPAATTTTTSDTATTAAVESAKAVAERRLDAVSSDVTTLIAH
jgi:phosphomannomutase